MPESNQPRTTDNQATSSDSGQVMDIKPPPSDSKTTSDPQAAELLGLDKQPESLITQSPQSNPATNRTPTATTEVKTPPTAQVAPEPSFGTADSDKTQKDTESMTSKAPKPTTTDKPAQQTDQKITKQATLKKLKSSKSHIIAIIVAILIMLGLAGAAVRMYLNEPDMGTPSNQTNQENTQPTSEQTEVTPATTGDIDNITNEISEELDQLDDDQDFSDDQVSDDTLGL